MCVYSICLYIELNVYRSYVATCTSRAVRRGGSDFHAYRLLRLDSTIMYIYLSLCIYMYYLHESSSSTLWKSGHITYRPTHSEREKGWAHTASRFLINMPPVHTQHTYNIYIYIWFSCYEFCFYDVYLSDSSPEKRGVQPYHLAVPEVVLGIHLLTDVIQRHRHTAEKQTQKCQSNGTPNRTHQIHTYS